jgi:hypothetical protein
VGGFATSGVGGCGGSPFSSVSPKFRRIRLTLALYVSDVHDRELPLPEQFLPRGGGYDPMARPGEKPVIRIGRADLTKLPAGQSETTKAEALSDVLGEGEDRLELVEDVPTKCPSCRGRGWTVFDQTTRRCPMCDGRGTLGSVP